MGNFNRGKRGFGGGGHSFGHRQGGSKHSMYQAVCSECGQECEIPFKPTGNRPVFCSTCFSKQQGGEERRRGFDSRRPERPSRFEDKKMFEVVCTKCGKNCEVPFRPTPGKPVYCDDCFDKGGKGGVDYSEQFKTLNDKLDKLIKLLTPAEKTEKATEKKTAKEVKKVVKTKAKVVTKKPVAKKKK